MSEQPSLAADLARVLTREPLGLPCDALSLRVQRQRSVVLAVPRTDPRFLHVGNRRGSRWRLIEEPASSRDGHGASEDGQGRIPDPTGDSALGSTILDRLEALERCTNMLGRRLDALERCFGSRYAAGTITPYLLRRLPTP
jgi:hypothetical protein